MFIFIILLSPFKLLVLYLSWLVLDVSGRQQFLVAALVFLANFSGVVEETDKNDKKYDTSHTYYGYMNAIIGFDVYTHN